MRTKSLLAAAALVAAGVLSSEAQNNVYSLNVVGYVNITLKPGYNLITPQLKDTGGSTQINTILTNAPALADFSQFFGWDNNTQNFTEAAVWLAGGWYDGGFNGLVSDTAPRGKGYFLKNEGAATTLTLVGEVPQGQDTTTLGNNYSFLGDYVPVAQEVRTNGYPIADFDTIFKFDADTQNYTEALVGLSGAFWDGGFNGEVPFVTAVGEGFVRGTVEGTAGWTRNFTVQP